MAYQSNKPQAADLLAQSQSDIANNFTAIGVMMDPDAGYIKFPRTVAVPVTAATTVGLYGAESDEIAGQTALWFLPQNHGTPVDFTSCLSAANGWARLPSGILFKWGALQTTATTATYNFPVAANIPVFAHAPHFVFVMPFADTGGHSYWITGKTTTTFSLRFNNGQNIYWFAVGD